MDLSVRTGQRPHRIGATILLALLLVSSMNSEIRAQTQWALSASNPVLNPGPAGSWDQNTVFLPCVIKTGDTLKMWYGGTDATVDQRRPQTGYAWSLDGISWTKYAGNPVLAKRASEWDDGGVAARAVIQDGDTLRLWYTGLSSTGTLGPGKNSAGYATSTDGLTWTRSPSPVLQPGGTGEWDSDIFEPGSVIKEDGVYKMWYSGGTGAFWQPSHTISIGHATSSDGMNWVKYNDTLTSGPPYQESDPVLQHGSSSAYDANRAWTPVVRKTTTGYEMWYTGGSVSLGGQVIMYATSPDGIHWTISNGPVLQATGSWMSNHVIAPSVIFGDGRYHMWFSGFAAPNFNTAKIGYATSTPAGNAIAPGESPQSTRLEQNYPNPFNPTTDVRYQVSRVIDVRISVYDLLGRELAVIVNERKAPGNYEVPFDASGLASGVYIYRMTAGLPAGQGGSFVQTRKMIVVR